MMMLKSRLELELEHGWGTSTHGGLCQWTNTTSITREYEYVDRPSSLSFMINAPNSGETISSTFGIDIRRH